ncbi:SnoaL-like protein [Kribbella sp. VKM Ac-2568]|nr:SnoaL-like protein [Kribbella sp. VKM Ac-2568]
MLEDVFVLRDHDAIGPLFEPDAVLHTTESPGPARGREQIRRFVQDLWGHQTTYLADPRTVLQAQATALIISGRSISVAHRCGSGTWRYAVVLLVPGGIKVGG